MESGDDPLSSGPGSESLGDSGSLGSRGESGNSLDSWPEEPLEADTHEETLGDPADGEDLVGGNSSKKFKIVIMTIVADSTRCNFGLQCSAAL